MKKDDSNHVIKADGDFREATIEFLGDTLLIRQNAFFSVFHDEDEVDLSGNQAKELYRILSQKYLVNREVKRDEHQ